MSSNTSTRPTKYKLPALEYPSSRRLSNVEIFKAHGLRPPQPDIRQHQSDGNKNCDGRVQNPPSIRTLRGTQRRRDPTKERKRVDIPSAESTLTQGLKSQYQNGKLVIAKPSPSPSTTFETARSRHRLSRSRTSDYTSAASTLRTIGRISNHSSSDDSSVSANMSSQPLLQTAPGNTSSHPHPWTFPLP